ncbi:MAG: alpha/beta hydrolase [Pirellulales bacterium]
MLVDLVRVSTADGLRLEGAMRSPADSTTAEIPIDAFLLLHGTGGNFYGSTMFDALADGLLALGSAVLTANTRGHDVVSHAASSAGAMRCGAAYERVDDCRHDIDAWISLLVKQGCRRIGLLGHSLGAIKAIYAQALAPHAAVACLIGVSPARLSYQWFLDSPRGELFRQTMAQAESLVANGQGDSLMQVEFPLPYVVTAAGYVDKYGREERYNVVRHVHKLTCPSLITFGSAEVQGNVAFTGLPEALEQAATGKPQFSVATIAGGDHVYSGVRSELVARIGRWLRKLPRE